MILGSNRRHQRLESRTAAAAAEPIPFLKREHRIHYHHNKLTKLNSGFEKKKLWYPWVLISLHVQGDDTYEYDLYPHTRLYPRISYNIS